MNLMMRLFKEEEGQGMIEYVLIAAGISIVAIAIIAGLKPKIQATWQAVSDGL